jgi:UDP-glucuronate 4-epimerase
MRNVLVTGGAGFIGSHLVEALAARGDGVVVLDDFNDFYAPNIKRANLGHAMQTGRVTLVEGDLCSSQDLTRALTGTQLDAVVHLAARAGVRPSLLQPELYARVNVVGTAALLEAARRAGIPRFVFGSSSSVYGARSTAPFSEDDRTDRPFSPYAATKVAGEAFCAAYRSICSMELVALRFFTVYGPRQRPDLAIAKFFRLLEQDQPLPFFGDGSSARDYTYVGDIVRGILLSLDRSWPTFEVVNLGGSSPVSLADLVKLIEATVGHTASLDRRPDQPGDVPLTCADPRKAKRLLGWEPMVPLAEGLRLYQQWLHEPRR